MPTSQWVVSKFIEEHNHDLATPLKVKRHHSHSSSHRSEDIQHLVCGLIVDGLGPTNLARYAILPTVVRSRTSRLHIVHKS